MPGGRFFSYEEPPERPADPAVRRANLRRIARLFVPYKLRLSAVLGLIASAWAPRYGGHVLRPRPADAAVGP